MISIQIFCAHQFTTSQESGGFLTRKISVRANRPPNLPLSPDERFYYPPPPFRCRVAPRRDSPFPFTLSRFRCARVETSSRPSRYRMPRRKFAISPTCLEPARRARRCCPRFFGTACGFLAFFSHRVSVKVTGKSHDGRHRGGVTP